MAAHADAGSLRRATASVPSHASAGPCAQPATQLSTRFWSDSFHSRQSSVPLSQFAFALLQFRLFDNFGRLLKKNFFTANAASPLVELAPTAIKATFATQRGHMIRLLSDFYERMF